MVDVKIKLSALWVAFFFSSIYGDVLRLYDPGTLEHLGVMTLEMMLLSAIFMEIPIVMGFLSLVLKDKANRRANMIIGIFFVCYNLIFFISSFFWATYETVLAIALVVFAALIVWYTWKWPTQEG